VEALERLNNMKFSIVLLFALLAISKAEEEKKEEESSSEIKEEKDVLVLTDKNFDSAIAANNYLLVEFCK